MAESCLLCFCATAYMHVSDSPYSRGLDLFMEDLCHHTALEATRPRSNNCAIELIDSEVRHAGSGSALQAWTDAQLWPAGWR